MREKQNLMTLSREEHKNKGRKNQRDKLIDKHIDNFELEIIGNTDRASAYL